jgi:murein DD-endopeptidase MepM/ murein hydrolase activator NlpD
MEEHVVAPGETRGALARRWRTTVGAIAELNGIADPNLISVGQRLRRPSVPGGTARRGAGGDTMPANRSVRLTFARLPLAPPAVLTGGFREDYGGYLHRGIDLGGVPVGTPIRAPAGGTVTVHRPGDGWGNGGFGVCVVLQHPGTPWWSIYAHMDSTERRNGEVVSEGEVIGAVGFTGNVVPAGPAGAHLHWQLSADPSFPIDFQFIANPLDFLQV